MIYEHFANKPGVHNTLRDFFSTYRHLQAEMYIPEVAALFVEPDGEILPDGPVNDWPFDTAWLTPPEEGRWMWARVLAGEELTMVLQTLQTNMGSFFFLHEGRIYRTSLVPWLPGVDYSEELK